MSWSAPVVPIGGPASGADLVDRFLRDVAASTLADWLPHEPARVLDLSHDSQSLLQPMLQGGHAVVHVGVQPRRPDIRRDPDSSGALAIIEADRLAPDWLRDASVDAVVAEGGTLSQALAAEVTLEGLHRVLRPGGQLLVSVDSLVAGLGRLADAGRWAELADVPAADVVLIPEAGGHVSRCFWPEELAGMLSAAGFDVEWIRPRSVLAEDTVVRALQQDHTQLEALVSTELALEAQRQGESVGRRLVASARRL
jgi:hypothetical protein